MGTRANIYVLTKGHKLLYYRHYNGYPGCTGRELKKLVKELEYDFCAISGFLNSESDTYKPVEQESWDAEYIYTIDCENQTVECYDKWDKRHVEESEYENYSHSGISGDFDDFDFGFSSLNGDDNEEFDPSIFDPSIIDFEGFKLSEQEWEPRFPVDMDNPSELTEAQKLRGEKIFEALCKFMDEHPDDNFAPMLCISQEWDISVDYGGWRSDSDYVDTATCVTCKDDEGFYLDPDYIMQCVPFIEKELKDKAERCMEHYGNIPSHKDQTLHRRTTLETQILEALWDVINAGRIDDAMLEIDTLEQSVYPMPSDAPKEEYGGIIRYVPVREYIVSDKYGNPDTDLDKIKLLAEEIDKAEW